MKLKKPKFWNYKRPGLLSILLLPFTIPIILNNFLNNLKNKSNNASQNKNNYNLKTICVGNIYIGGTGKTPSVIKINQILKDLEYKTVFIKKNYKDSYDEHKLLEKHGNVLSSSKRIDSLIKASKICDVAIFDDGLQDASIKYDLKFVCFNVKSFIGNGMLIPSGPLREKISSLKKYDAVFLNGNNENLDEIISKIEEQNKNIKIFESNYKLINLDNFNKKDRYLAFAGIGIPSNFHTTLINNGIKIVKFLEYPDHWKYDYKELEKIINIAKSMNAKIITTEKDYVRLENHNILQKENIKFLKMELKIKNESELINYLKTNI